MHFYSWPTFRFMLHVCVANVKRIKYCTRWNLWIVPSITTKCFARGCKQTQFSHNYFTWPLALDIHYAAGAGALCAMLLQLATFAWTVYDNHTKNTLTYNFPLSGVRQPVEHAQLYSPLRFNYSLAQSYCRLFWILCVVWKCHDSQRCCTHMIR